MQALFKVNKIEIEGLKRGCKQRNYLTSGRERAQMCSKVESGFWWQIVLPCESNDQPAKPQSFAHEEL